MIFPLPTKYFMVAGSSDGVSELNAFDGALLNSGIGNTNLLKVSSILPSNCIEISPFKFKEGSLVPIAYSSITSSVCGQLISSAVSIAHPVDNKNCGVIMEFHNTDSRSVTEERTQFMAEESMKIRGVEVKCIQSVSSEHIVEKNGASFSGVVLWT
ncbi:MAG: pyruvoyl-dependent arginine decarboxylase [bacterium]